MNQHNHTAPAAWYNKPSVRLLAIPAIVGVYFLVQYWEQVSPFWPWLLIIAMPLMHLFGHGGHGAGGGHDSEHGQGGHASHGGGCCGGGGKAQPKPDLKQPVARSDR